MKPIAHIVRLGCLLGMVNVFAGVGPAIAQQAPVKAGDVNKDPATLRAFVEYAKTQLDDISDAAELAVLWGSMRLGVCAAGVFTKGEMCLCWVRCYVGSGMMSFGRGHRGSQAC